MPGGRGLAILAVVTAAGIAGVAVAQTMPNSPSGPTYLQESRTECWRCHTVPVGGAPGIVHYAMVVPPPSAGAEPGQPFDYAVQVQNTWSGELTYIEPILDLTAAPALGFVSDVPSVELSVDDTIPVEPTQPTANHSRSLPLALSEGLTHLRIAIEPQDTDPVTGPDLVLRVRAAPGTPEMVRDEAGRGQPEVLLLEGREAFSGLGYGNWTVTAEVTPVRVGNGAPGAADPTSLAGVPPLDDVPFRLVAAGEARDAPDRVLALPLRVSIPASRTVTATFHLVATSLPAGPQAAEARLQGHVHYEHNPQSQAVDDADFLAPSVPLHVAAVGEEVVVSSTAIAILPPAIQNGPTMATVAESVGYASGFLLVSSSWAGGLFGKTSRRQLNTVFGSAKRRVAFHNFVSYGLILAALGHTTLFLVEASYGWTVGLLWGGLAVLAMLGLGLTGALQVPMIRKWSFGSWRWSHWALAIGAVLFTIAHIALDGVHFADVQEALGWRDPLAAARP